ncbi:hypothetical protein DL769_004167 [Monosporascus sp. CRB-8-3]|nr:hypothetical protein DL769_004167 [Monosporascus sp. CRB-8-3]
MSAPTFPPGGTILDTFKKSFVDVPVDADNDNAIATTEFLDAAESLTTIFGVHYPMFVVVSLAFSLADTLCRSLDALGSVAFSPVKNDMMGNIKLAAPAESETLQALVKNELKDKKHVATEGLLWLVRGLDFTCIALSQNVAKPSEELADSFKNAYGATLKPHHSFLVKPVFSAALSACPYRKTFYEKLGSDEAKVQSELRVYLAALEKVVGILKGFQDRKEAKWEYLAMRNIDFLLPLGLSGLVSAVPLSSRQFVPNYPPTSTSKGFRLIVNVTDPTKDLSPPVNGWSFSTVHTGAGLSDAVVSADQGIGRIYYQNGTAEEIRYKSGSVLSDGGTPLFPWGIRVQARGEADEPAVRVNAGSGTKGVALSAFPEPYSYLTGTNPGVYAVCPRFIPYYNATFNVVRWAYDEFDYATGFYERTVPEDCVAVNFLPQCADLPEPPEGSLSSHEFAANSKCYEDVRSIDWPQYGP